MRELSGWASKSECYCSAIVPTKYKAYSPFWLPPAIPVCYGNLNISLICSIWKLSSLARPNITGTKMKTEFYLTLSSISLKYMFPAEQTCSSKLEISFYLGINSLRTFDIACGPNHSPGAWPEFEHMEWIPNGAEGSSANRSIILW